jgi:hypothetical protein
MMKNAMILTGLWLAILATAYSMVYWEAGSQSILPIAVLQTSGPAATFVHPEGRFDLSVPTDWSVAEVEDGARVLGPESRTTGWVLFVEEEELCRAVDAAVLSVDPTLDEMQAIEEPAMGDPCLAMRMRPVQEEADASEYLAVRARRIEGGTMVMLLLSDALTPEALRRQLDTLWEGMQVPAEATVLL